MTTAIHWFRRDLRLTDNTALARAVKEHDVVLPLYIVSDWNGAHRWTGPARQSFLCGCLSSLAANLEAAGGCLVLRRGNAVESLRQLLIETGADAIYYNRDPDPFGRAVEKRVKRMAGELGCRVVECKDVAIHERDELLTGQGTPYRIFTPYYRAWARLEKPPVSHRITHIACLPGLNSDPIPTNATWRLPEIRPAVESGEKAARRRLKTFLKNRILRYGAERDVPSANGTSRFSQDLRFGTLSIREIHQACMAAMEDAKAEERGSIQTLIKELVWREFYFQILWNAPEVLEREFNPKLREIPWHDPDEKFEMWKEGRTGFPIVDAGMRQLSETGFMHNRLRMITAMFLTKDLHLDWRLGERYFMQELVDGEIASNNGGWQWSAGTGADAAPYFRIQNPWTQSRRFDPQGEYIRKWVPELQKTGTALLYKVPPAGKPIADGYPEPVVNHQVERERTLAMFHQFKLNS